MINQKIDKLFNFKEKIILITGSSGQLGISFCKLFLDMGISDYVSPEFNPIPETNSFLLVLSPDRDHLQFWPFIISFIKTTIGIFILRILYLVFQSYGEKISELWSKMINLLF